MCAAQYTAEWERSTGTCHRRNLRTARNGVMLADDVVVADFEIAALAGEILVQRIGPQHRTR